MGAARLRPGAEASLKPAEIKALLREAQPASLTLHEDGAFRHRNALEGRFTIEGGVLRFVPDVFDGMTHASMRARAEESGREFGLGWLFDPFELIIEADGTMATVTPSVMQVAYTRKPKKSAKE